MLVSFQKPRYGLRILFHINLYVIHPAFSKTESSIFFKLSLFLAEQCSKPGSGFWLWDQLLNFLPFIFIWQMNWSQKAIKMPILSTNSLYLLCTQNVYLITVSEWKYLSSLKFYLPHQVSFRKITINMENLRIQNFQMLYFQGRITCSHAML